MDSELNRAVFSNYVNNIDMGLAAPGVNIYSTIPGSKYEAYNGTSMATPYVAGLVGLMKSLKPSLTTKEAYRILRDTGKNTRNTKETGKLIQPGAAVNALIGGREGGRERGSEPSGRSTAEKNVTYLDCFARMGYI
ncbi:MAG: S8 family serine peptidase [Saprospiraceae bacterium]|nr:S8 family serine peptidase [Saprospiraceae bacterium]